MCSTCSSQKHTASGPFTRSWLRGWPLTWRATSTRRSEMSWRFVPFADAETLSSGYFVGSGSPNESNWACFTWRGFTFLSSSPGSSLSWSSSPWPSIWSTLTKWRWGQKGVVLKVFTVCGLVRSSQCDPSVVSLQLPRPQRFPSSYLSRVETLVETVSEHIFWKNKEMQEETRSANLAVAAFVKVRLVWVYLMSWSQVCGYCFRLKSMLNS